VASEIYPGFTFSIIFAVFRKIIMNNRVSVRKCLRYDPFEVRKHIEDIYRNTGGPSVKGKRVLIKPNILSDHDPAKCISTHPVVVKAMVEFIQSEGAASVSIGDSPAVHTKNFRPEKSGIYKVCLETGAEWVDFTANPVEKRLNRGKIKVAAAADEADIIISIPKLKNHELVYFTGAVKNSLGFVPGFHKAKQHALHHDREGFSNFLVDLNEAITPDYFFMDGITGMEGPGPARGIPVQTGVLMGSSNPAALDIIASSIAGYEPLTIPTTRIAIHRKKWLTSPEDVLYEGPSLETLVKKDFKRVPLSHISNISLKFLMNRISFLKKLERRPVFIHGNCTGCLKCVRICPVEAIKPMTNVKNYIRLTDRKCIRCFCCSEVCSDNAVEVRHKYFGE
jgi:uncharacterized protein (DUF362 family)/Pyruvate/2-oxoacid:ferredoxin oxidoreductase delta subunit